MVGLRCSYAQENVKSRAGLGAMCRHQGCGLSAEACGLRLGLAARNRGLTTGPAEF